MAETVGYLAIDSCTGVWTGLPFEVFNTPAIVTDQWESITFEGFYQSGPPHLLSSIASYNGLDNSHVRYGSLSEMGVDFKIAEDRTQDTELAHSVGESVAYLAIGGSGIVTAAAPELAPTVTSLIRNGHGEQYDRLDSVSIVFDGHVIVDGADLSLRNASTGGTPVDLSGYAFDYDAATSTASWEFADVAERVPAFYTVTLDATSITGMTGLALDGNGEEGGNYSATLLVAKAGDTDLDADVDFTDARNLITHFDPSGANSGNSWSKGNFDSNMNVDRNDFNVLAANFSAENYAATPANNLVASRRDLPVLLAVSAVDSWAVHASMVDSDSHVPTTDRAFADIDFTGSEFVDDQPFSSRARRSLRPVIEAEKIELN